MNWSPSQVPLASDAEVQLAVTTTLSGVDPQPAEKEVGLTVRVIILGLLDCVCKVTVATDGLHVNESSALPEEVIFESNLMATGLSLQVTGNEEVDADAK